MSESDRQKLAKSRTCLEPQREWIYPVPAVLTRVTEHVGDGVRVTSSMHKPAHVGRVGSSAERREREMRTVIANERDRRLRLYSNFFDTESPMSTSKEQSSKEPATLLQTQSLL